MVYSELNYMYILSDMLYVCPVPQPTLVAQFVALPTTMVIRARFKVKHHSWRMDNFFFLLIF